MKHVGFSDGEVLELVLRCQLSCDQCEVKSSNPSDTPSARPTSPPTACEDDKN
eukprot:CAMPEP_0113323144 /NCGR_PEP_ID=MMETSP0010_2-20120614/16087_1 /TAXON_ID=216773 ORGANISM="Corethron hystrix, Strain 308" /NCGR_SAMPLE_ID=MMETSP0010_2 /ASSEMBLY_ACC=CAM_ASM_000155 /LENGTH=52 /DNA_ID=CAMNT_0000181901 /DNA_START=209 /DNA_END=364 /DNA_ORIENTATION=+ /assembly_acc=CAM_ASM_000155